AKDLLARCEGSACAMRRICLRDAKDLLARCEGSACASEGSVCATRRICVSARVPDRAEKLPVPRCGDPFARGVGAGLVGPRGDPRVALLADVPILPVGLVPEAHGIAGTEARLPEGVGVEQPLAGEARTVGR